MRRLIGGWGLAVVFSFAGLLLFAGDPGVAAPSLPFSISPGSGAFSDTQIGGTTLKTFTFTWTSSQSGTLSNFIVSPPFAIQSNSCTSMTMANQDTCTVTASFAPTQAGSATEDLTFDYSVGTEQGTDSITLSGDGVTTPTLPFTYSPGSAEFPDTRVGSKSSITFTFTWTSLPGGLTNFSAQAPFAIQTNTCGAMSYPNSCTVTVRFTPTGLGRAGGQLTFSYTAGAQQGTDEIQLNGNSSRCQCTRLKARMIGWSTNRGRIIHLALRWKLSCAPGHTLSCAGRLQWRRDVKKRLASRGLKLAYPRRSEGFSGSGRSPSVGITCGAIHRRGCTEDLIAGVAHFELLGPAALRRGLKITWRFDVVCFAHPKQQRKRTLTIKFNKRGTIDFHASHLGPIVS
jgi:hypothetical protein